MARIRIDPLDGLPGPWPVPPVVEERLRPRVRGHPFGHQRGPGRVAAVPVHEQDPPEALAVERVEQVAEDVEERVDAERRASGEGAEVRRQPVGERGEHRDAERLGCLDGDALGEDRVGAEREERVLLGRSEREHDPIVAREVLLELHPVAVPDAHRASLWAGRLTCG